jgi:hypothetical protein
MLVLFSMLFSLLTPIVSTSAQAVIAPSIRSDKDDYPAGGLVVLTGGDWEPGKTVHIKVDDDQTKTWTRDVDVAADGDGKIKDTFELPDWFVATYKVVATGPASGTATTGFTDGNVKIAIAPSGVTASITRTPYSTTDCTGTAGKSSTGVGTKGVGKDSSLRLDASDSGTTSTGTASFADWAVTGATSTTIKSTGGRSVCVEGFNSGSANAVANYTLVQDQTITFAQPTSPQAYGNTFNVNPTASSGLAVTVTRTGGCTVEKVTTGYDVRMTSGTDSCVLTASQAGDTKFNSASSVERTVAASKRAVEVTADAKSKVWRGRPGADLQAAHWVAGGDGCFHRCAGS